MDCMKEQTKKRSVAVLFHSKQKQIVKTRTMFDNAKKPRIRNIFETTTAFCLQNLQAKFAAVITQSIRCFVLNTVPRYRVC